MSCLCFFCFISGLSGDGDDEGDRKRFYEAIDQLALAFSSRSVPLKELKRFPFNTSRVIMILIFLKLS